MSQRTSGSNSTLFALLVAFRLSCAIAKIIDATLGFRVKPEDEMSGIDVARHAN